MLVPPRVRRRSARGVFWLWAAFALLCGAHLATLKTPMPDSDEPAFADFALHGELSHYKELLPPGQRIFLDGYGFGLSPGQMAVLRASLTRLGVGLFQLRLPSLACGLASLGLLLWLSVRLEASWWCRLALLLFGASVDFFLSTHNARSESMVMLVMVLNMAWLLLEGGRATALLAGLLATAAFLLHPQAVLFWISFPILAWVKEGRSLPRSARYYWWATGAAAGLVVILYSVDVDQFSRYLQLQTIVYRSAFVSPPALIRYHWNPAAALNGELALFFRVLSWGPWHSWLLGGMLTAACLQLRRFRDLPPNDRLVLVAALSLVVAHGFLRASATINYVLIFYPWWVWLFAQTAYRLHKGTLALDAADWFIAACVLLMIAFKSGDAAAAALFAALAIRLAAEYRAKPAANAVFWLGFLALLFFGLGSALPGFAGLWRPLLFRSPLLAAGLALLPWVVLAVGPGGAVSVRETALDSRKVMAGLLVAVFCLDYSSELTRNYSRVKWTRAHQVLVDRFAELRDEPRIVGPMILWLYEPTLRLQCLDNVLMTWPRLESFDPLPAMTAYRPSLILWPRADVPRLMALSRRLRPRWTLTPGEAWVIPVGAGLGSNFQALRLTPR